MSKNRANTRCGFVAILGIPNAGKSTLLNRMVGGKVSIVTPKAQTTRARLRGVCMRGDTQIIFVDTPGIFAASRTFEKGLVKEAWAGLDDADVALLLVDARKGLDEETLAILEQLKKRTGTLPIAVAINKVDTVEKPYLLKLATLLSGYDFIDEIFMISAEKGGGVEDIGKWLGKTLPEGPWHYPDDQLTDAPMREIAAEITREKLFLLLRQELPYSLKVETEKWEEQPSGNVKIMQQIVVERENQKKIVIGHKGETIKKAGMRARQELEKMLERKVHLELFVKVDAGWKDRPGG